MTFAERFQRLALAILLVTMPVAVCAAQPDTKRVPAPVASPAQPKVQEGLKALAAKDLERAAAAFDEGAKLDPKSALPLLGLAEVARLRNDAQTAETLHRKAISVAPNSAEAQL